MSNELTDCRQLITAAAAGFIVMCALFSPSTSWADEALQVIDGHGAGKIIYGVMDRTSPANAMSNVLNYVHHEFGTAPVVGKVFESRDGQNFGAFFTVTANTAGGKSYAGLAIVSMAAGMEGAAAALYDESARFAQSEPKLLRTLDEAWRAAAASPGSVRESSRCRAAAQRHTLSGWQRSR